MMSWKTDMSLRRAKKIMHHWKNNTKESEKIRFIDVFTAERIIDDRKQFKAILSSKAIIVCVLLLVASTQVSKI